MRGHANRNSSRRGQWRSIATAANSGTWPLPSLAALTSAPYRSISATNVAKGTSWAVARYRTVARRSAALDVNPYCALTSKPGFRDSASRHRRWSNNTAFSSGVRPVFEVALTGAVERAT